MQLIRPRPKSQLVTPQPHEALEWIWAALVAALVRGEGVWSSSEWPRPLGPRRCTVRRRCRAHLSLLDRRERTHSVAAHPQEPANQRPMAASPSLVRVARRSNISLDADAHQTARCAGRGVRRSTQRYAF
jgi:hypothetical protein